MEGGRGGETFANVPKIYHKMKIQGKRGVNKVTCRVAYALIQLYAT